MQESTTGAVSQFLEKESCDCLQSIRLLSFLCGALQRYEEEGAVLNPRLILCNSIDEFSRSLPGGRFVVIGNEVFSPDSGKKILKQCATLATSGWVVFVERIANGTKIRFGVLSFLASPTSMELREMVALGQDPTLGSPPFVALIEKIDPKTVAITGSRGNTLQIAFSTTRSPEDETGINSFSASCCKAASAEGFSSYFQKFLFRALNESHGSILVCGTSRPIKSIKGMSDAVLIDPPLDIHAAFSSYRSISSSESILELQRTEALLIGMLQSDGIVVFSEEGTVIAYRVFYKDTRSKKGATKSAEAPIGGARRRAFEGVKALVGTDIKSALFRSQDGITIYQGA